MHYFQRLDNCLGLDLGEAKLALVVLIKKPGVVLIFVVTKSGENTL